MAEALKIDDWKNPLGAPDAKTALGSTTEPTKPATPDKTESPKPGGVIAASSEIGKGAEEASRKIAAYEAEAGKLTPPQLKPVPPPTPKVTDPIEVFGSAAMIFAGLGSMLSRRHMTTALNAATAVMNSFKANDTAATEQAYKVWQAETQNALQVADFQSKAYNAALGNILRRESQAEKEGVAKDKTAEARVKALSYAFSDPIMAQELERGGIDAAAKLQQARQDKVDDAAKAAREIEPKYQGALAMKNAMADPAWATSDNQGKADLLLKYGHPEAVKAVEAARKKNAASGLGAEITEDERETARAIANYAVKPPTSGRNNYARIMAEVSRINPEYRMGQYGIPESVEKHWVDPNAAGGKQIQSFDRVAQHLGVMEGLIDAMNNGNYPAFNAIANRASIAVGATPVTNFETAKQIVMNEVLKATSGVAGTGEDREKAQEALRNSASPEQLHQALDLIKDLIGGGLQSSQSLYSAGTNKPPSEFMKLLSPETQKVFAKQLHKPGGAESGAKTEPGRAETKTTPAVDAPPAEAVEDLRKMKDDPEARQQFDDVFGAGAADAALGGK